MLRRLLIAVLFMALSAAALASDVSGTWKAQFDSRIGKQSYTFEFHLDNGKLTGKAANEQFGSTDIIEGKVDGDNITFVEPLNFQGNELRIVYTGKIDGDSIKFTRKVGDMATEELTATRVKQP